MKTFNLIRKGFTIVELVIVIAVIAILAGVLIPTFSGVIKRANLSADKQAVREMNMALAADEAIHGRPSNVEGAMKVLADAGYDADNWVCLTKGYEVYWFEKDNRLILYNASTAEVEYPENYDKKIFVDAQYKDQFHIYNQNHKKAVSVDTSLGSFSSGDTGKNAGELSSNATTTSSKSALDSVAVALSNEVGSGNDGLKKALGLQSNDTAYVYGTKEEIAGDADSNAYASMQILSVGSTEEPTSEELKSDGTLKQNLFVVQVNTKENATPTEVAAAEKSAGDLVYSVFTQINTTQLSSDVSVVFPADTKIDVSGKEWAAVKYFSGYFGTADDAHPMVIRGAEMSSATGFSQTVAFTGSGSKYFVTGFFGTVYGNATIENVIFEDITIQEPAMDYALSNADIQSGKSESRNTVSIIGGITDKESDIPAYVYLRNIVVRDSVEIACGASGGGLVGYIGATQDGHNLKGQVAIENCHVSAYVHTNYVSYKEGAGKACQYGVIGGLIGFTCRAENTELEIIDCIFDGKLEGTTCVGGCIGNVISIKSLTFTGNNSFEKATIIRKGGYALYGAITYIGKLTTLNGKMKLSDGASVTYQTNEDPRYALVIGSKNYHLTGTGTNLKFTE